MGEKAKKGRGRLQVGGTIGKRITITHPARRAKVKRAKSFPGSKIGITMMTIRMATDQRVAKRANQREAQAKVKERASLLGIDVSSNAGCMGPVDRVPRCS